MNAEQLGSAKVSPKTISGYRQVPVILSRLVHGCRQETRDAETGTRLGYNLQGVRRSIQYVSTARPLDMDVNKAGRQDASLCVDDLIRYDIGVGATDPADDVIADQDAAERICCVGIVQPTVLDKK